MAPRLTVLMCVYNGLPYLEQAIQSILGQTFGDFEFLIVEDGSRDRSWEVLQEYAARDSRVALVRNQQNLGLTRSLNVGLDHARGELIARQDADDFSLPSRLERQVRFMDSQPEVALLGTQCGIMDAQGRSMGMGTQNPISDAGIRLLMLIHSAFVAGACVFRRLEDKTGPMRYDPAMLHAEDYDFYSRLMEKGQAANLPQQLMLFRRHEASVSSVYTDIQEVTADRIAAQNFARQGLGADFTPEQVTLLRSFGERARNLSGQQRLEQVRGLLRLLQEGGRRLQVPGADLKTVRGKLLSKVRYGYPPLQWDLAARWAYLRTLLADPLGYAADRLRWARYRLQTRRAGDSSSG